MEKIIKEYDKKKKKLDSFATTLNTLISSIMISEGIVAHSIVSRVKDRDSLEKKVIEKLKYEKMSDITDVVGVRIITHYSDEVDKIAEIIEREFSIDRKNSIDKRRSLEPNAFGYLSLHYVISLNSDRCKLTEYKAFEGMNAEFQVRSILQHAWAEIEHDTGYKTENSVPTPIRRQFSRLAGLLEIADEVFINIRNSLDKYQSETDELFQNHRVEEIDIDKITLKSYLFNSLIIKEMCDEIAVKHGGRVMEKIEIDDSTMNDLSCTGVKTIGQLDSELKKHKCLILKRADFLVGTFKNARWEFIEKSKAADLCWPITILILCFTQVYSAMNLSMDDLKKYIEKIRPTMEGNIVHNLASQLKDLVNQD